MIEIPLTQNKFALVDDIDKDLINFNWCAGLVGTGNDYYALRTIYRPRKKTLYLHRVVLLRVHPDFHNLRCDHINGNTLDNRRSNLRPATPRQNNRNTIKRIPKTSVYKGVYWRKNRSTWVSTIRVDGKLVHLGSFKTQEEAAHAYDTAAKKYFGEFAKLNFSSS